MTASRALLACIALALAGCGSDAAPTPPAEAPPAPADNRPPRELQRQIDQTQAVDMVGYDGAALKRSIERSVDATEENNRKAEAARQAASGQ